ncbi:transposase [Thiopseudomonas alkaliphila]|uniref:transposase n=1 Tax=Thiopseudomonas alkaliphila TaxID=1697053 RepID=UPI003570C7C7
MRKNNTYRTGRHCVFELHAHLVFITKCRGAVFADNHLRSLESIFRSVCTDFEGVSSRRLKLLHPELVKPAYMKNALWSPSYYAGSVGGAPISVIRQYIEQQARPH